MTAFKNCAKLRAATLYVSSLFANGPEPITAPGGESLNFQRNSGQLRWKRSQKPLVSGERTSVRRCWIW